MATINKNAADHLLVSGHLNYATVPDIHIAAQALLSNTSDVVVDLSQVQYSNSAGLALLAQWYRFALSHQQRFQVINPPAQLLAIARVTGMDKVLQLNQ